MQALDAVPGDQHHLAGLHAGLVITRDDVGLDHNGLAGAEENFSLPAPFVLIEAPHHLFRRGNPRRDLGRRRLRQLRFVAGIGRMLVS